MRAGVRVGVTRDYGGAVRKPKIKVQTAACPACCQAAGEWACFAPQVFARAAPPRSLSLEFFQKAQRLPRREMLVSETSLPSLPRSPGEGDGFAGFHPGLQA